MGPRCHRPGHCPWGSQQTVQGGQQGSWQAGQGSQKAAPGTLLTAQGTLLGSQEADVATPLAAQKAQHTAWGSLQGAAQGFLQAARQRPLCLPCRRCCGGVRRP